MRAIVIDWGTTNRRVFALEDGRINAVERDGMGVLTPPPGGFPAEIARLRERFGADEVLLAGMIGSNRGWVDAGYLPAPLDLRALSRGLVRPMPGVGIMPGVSWSDGTRADVMRGEEVQLLGLAGEERLLACLPGTHCKWAAMDGFRLERFATAMTGELYALLRDHALIGAEMTGTAADDAGFAAGLAAAAEGDWLNALFGVRARRLLGLAPPGDAASFVSGLLIGSDVAARVAPGQAVTLVAGGSLAALYTRAIEGRGGSVRLVDPEAAFIAGCVRIGEGE